MLNTNVQQIIRESLAGLKHPVRLVLFTSDSDPELSPAARELVRAIKDASPRIALESYDLIMDRDKTLEYGVERVPTLIVQGQGGRTVKLSGTVEGLSLVLLLDAIEGVASGRTWFPGKISETLKLLERPVAVKIVLENDCPLCRPVAETAVGLALTHKMVSADIIVGDDYPEILAKHRIKVLPYALFGTSLHAEGHIDESSFLELLFNAQGTETKRTCVVCGNPSPETICQECKTKIRAEAVGHKRKEENLHETGTIVKPRRNP